MTGPVNGPVNGDEFRFQRLGFRVWGHLPWAVRIFVVRRTTPSFHVGAICVIERPDGSYLLVRHSYRPGWGFPGGFLKRHESPADAVRREVREEVGVEIVLDNVPKVVVDAPARRVDVIYTATPADDAPPRPTSPEILEARWFPIDELPDLQTESASALIELGRAKRPL